MSKSSTLNKAGASRRRMLINGAGIAAAAGLAAVCSKVVYDYMK